MIGVKMERNSTYLGIELIGLSQDEIEEIKKSTNKDVHLKEIGERLFIFPISEKASDFLEGIGTDIDIDTTRLRLVWINVDSDEVKESDLIAQVPDVELDDDRTFEVFDTNLVASYIEDNKELVNSELNEIVDDSEASSEEDDETFEGEEQFSEEESTEEEPEEESNDFDNEFEEDFDDDFSEDAEPEESSNEEEFEENSTEDNMYNSMFGEDDFSEDAEPEPSTTNSDLSDKTIEDPLMQKAITIFNRETHGDELPVFDAKISKLLSEELVEAGNHLQNARNHTITEIYNVLKETHDKEYEEAEAGQIADAKAATDKNIQQIKDNRETRIAKMSAQERSDYQKRKEDAGKVYLQEFYDKYDKKYLDELNDVISKQTQPIVEKAEQEVKDEEAALDKYIDEVKESVFKHVVEHADVEKLIEGYQKTLNNEKDNLLRQAEKIQNENTELKQKVSDLERTLQIHKETQEARIQAAVAESVEENNRKWQKELEKEVDKQKELLKASEDEKELLSKTISEKDEKIEDQLSENKKLTNKVVSLSETTQAVVPVLHKSPDKQQNQSGLVKVLIGAVAVLAIFGTGISGYAIASATHHNNVPITQVVPANTSSTNSQTTSSNNSQNSSSNSADDDSSSTKEFTYTDQNGKKHQVIKDDDVSGHYVDDQGKTHTVIFK